MTELLHTALGQRLPKYRPSVALARGTNGNIRQLLTDRRQHIIDSTDPAEVAAICRGIMRKIVRTGFTLVMPRYHGWTSDLEQAATIFAVYYPVEAAAMNEALAFVLGAIHQEGSCPGGHRCPGRA